jgi:phage terminase Nu1 subunit (DNA packaging protein)
LHRSHPSIVNKAVWLRRKGLLEMKRAQPSTVRKWRSKIPLKPDKQDFDAVKMDYCREHQITVAELSARFEQNDQLVAELYRLAQAAKRTRLPG